MKPGNILAVIIIAVLALAGIAIVGELLQLALRIGISAVAVLVVAVLIRYLWRELSKP